MGERRPVDPPVLKHGPLLRVTFGHLTDPARLKEILQEHVAYADEMHRKRGQGRQMGGSRPAWAYARVALQWAERYYANERELTLKMIKELDEAEAEFPRAGDGGRERSLARTGILVRDREEGRRRRTLRQDPDAASLAAM